MPVILHHVARGVVPGAKVGAQPLNGCSEIGRDRVGKVGELASTGLDMEGGQLGADRHRLGIDARVQRAELGAQLGAQLLGASLGHELVVGTPGLPRMLCFRARLFREILLDEFFILLSQR